MEHSAPALASLIGTLVAVVACCPATAAAALLQVLLEMDIEEASVQCCRSGALMELRCSGEGIYMVHNNPWIVSIFLISGCLLLCLAAAATAATAAKATWISEQQEQQ